MQVARLDDFVTNTAQKVEATSELLQHKVFSSMRRVRAIVSAGRRHGHVPTTAPAKKQR